MAKLRSLSDDALSIVILTSCSIFWALGYTIESPVIRTLYRHTAYFGLTFAAILFFTITAARAVKCVSLPGFRYVLSLVMALSVIASLLIVQLWSNPSTFWLRVEIATAGFVFSMLLLTLIDHYVPVPQDSH